MFIGHFAVALAAKRPAEHVSLGWLFAACQLPDLTWPVLLLAGVERARIAPGDTAFTPLEFTHYPWSHSLLMVVIQGVALAALYAITHRRDVGDHRGALVVGALVVSHWFLDWITHRPDVPLVPWSDAALGLGLWHSVAATLVLEILMFAAGVAIYARASAARDRTGRWAFWTLAAFLVLVYIANAFGPPPPDMRTVAISALSIWLLVAWAWWADAHRMPDRGMARAAADPDRAR